MDCSAGCPTAAANQSALGRTTGTPEVRPSRASRTGTALLKSPARAADRDRTVSRRSKRSSRAAAMDEQPNPGTYSSPRMRRDDIELPNLPVDMPSWAGSAGYPRGTFYSLSDTASKASAGPLVPRRPCSNSQSPSQAPLCTCTRHLIGNGAASPRPAPTPRRRPGQRWGCGGRSARPTAQPLC